MNIAGLSLPSSWTLPQRTENHFLPLSPDTFTLAPTPPDTAAVLTLHTEGIFRLPENVLLSSSPEIEMLIFQKKKKAGIS